MRHLSISLCLVLGLLPVPAYVMAQEPEGESSNPVVEAGRELLRVLMLPQMADSVREAGVPDGEVAAVLESARDEGIPAVEIAEVFEQSVGAIRENGPIDNFGAFVQSQLASGLRGRDLAEAIHAEHARRGIGKGGKLDRPRRGALPEGRGRDSVEAGRWPEGRRNGRGNDSGIRR